MPWGCPTRVSSSPLDAAPHQATAFSQPLTPAQQDPCFPFCPSPVHPSPLSQSKVHLGPPQDRPLDLVASPHLPCQRHSTTWALGPDLLSPGLQDWTHAAPCYNTLSPDSPNTIQRSAETSLRLGNCPQPGESSWPSLPHPHTSDIPSPSRHWLHGSSPAHWSIISQRVRWGCLPLTPV